MKIIGFLVENVGFHCNNAASAPSPVTFSYRITKLFLNTTKKKPEKTKKSPARTTYET